MNVDRILASTSDDDLEDEEDARAALEAILQEEESDEDDMFLTKGCGAGTCVRCVAGRSPRGCRARAAQSCP